MTQDQPSRSATPCGLIACHAALTAPAGDSASKRPTSLWTVMALLKRMTTRYGDFFPGATSETETMSPLLIFSLRRCAPPAARSWSIVALR